MSNEFAADISAVQSIGAVQKILEVVCRTTGMGFSAVARVTEDRWIACAVRDEISFGLKPGGELEVGTTICNEIRDSGQLVVIDHVAKDPHFCKHPTPQRYGFQSYISVPIRLRDGQFFGTLCAIDPRPAKVNTPETVGMFQLFAELIAQHLKNEQRVAASEAALLDERNAAGLREQFIAVLGHDLRNPLSAILTGAHLLKKMPVGTDTTMVSTLIERSAKRMAGLIDDVLDFARGRLGGGLGLKLTSESGLAAALEQVVTELQTPSPEKAIRREIRIDRPVTCDSARIAQLTSNLLANAITHGDATWPVYLRALTDGDQFVLSVTNRGETIAPVVAERLFLPFERGSAKPGQEGLGLGLYIASEIARAHQGTLSVSSVDGETTFTLKMPV